MLLYCNGRKQTLARWPNSGYVEVKKVINPGSVKSNIQPVFEYEDERHARWTKAEDPWLYSFLVYNWVPRRIPIRQIDTSAKTIVIDPYGHADRDGIGTVPWQKTLPYFALNMLEEIDSPGEWYLDRAKGILYLYPPSNPDSSVIELGMLSQVMVSMDKVSHIRMEHLKLDLARGDCMTIKSGSHILLAGCSFTRFGNNGINVADGNAVGHPRMRFQLHRRFSRTDKRRRPETTCPCGAFHRELPVRQSPWDRGRSQWRWQSGCT